MSVHYKTDMKKIIVLFAALLCFGCLNAAAQMSDDQVIQYAQSALKSGKSETEIGKELLARGVTRAQAERIKNSLMSEQSTSVTGQLIDSKLSTRAVAGSEIRTENVTEDSGAEEVYEYTEAEASTGSDIFGHNIFRSRTLTFEPNENTATPENYRLGPGDEVVIEIWGDNEALINQVISPEGRISISRVGPVQLSGLTIDEASTRIRKALSTKFSGLDGSKSSVSVTLGRIRTIQVNVLGEVNTPGTYRLSAFSTVFNAIYRAGGVTATGSLRDIKVVRSGKEIASVDVYGYLLDGRTDIDIRLQEGDVIMVPTYGCLVEIAGKVKRPMKYEMKEGESVETLLQYAGGFASDAFRANLSLVRQSGDEREILTVEDKDYASCMLEDGDAVDVGASLDRFSNMVEVRGYVFRPGQYQLGGDIATVRQLVNFAGGPKEDAFLPRAVLIREKEDLSVETLSVDLAGVLSGASEDVLLRKNDVLVVSGIHELEDRGTLTINGMVARPGEFVFSDNTTIEDLILQAGGLLEGASTARVDVARRIMDSDSMEASDTLGQTFSFPIRDGFAVDGGENFILEPYDVVSVRRSPGYRSQTYVNLGGAVTFPGEYQLLRKDERISDLIARAGGVTKQAYLKGARIIRANDNGDSEALGRLMQTAASRDSLSIDTSTSSYNVAVDLEKALARPGSDYDVVLKTGDVITIPEYTGTVRVIGEVMFPNAVTYEPGKSVKYYVNAAGGYNVNAKRSKAFIVYMNGSAARSGSLSAKVEPGCTIVVPAKPERGRMSVGEIASITSASSSLASVIAVLTNLFL